MRSLRVALLCILAGPVGWLAGAGFAYHQAMRPALDAASYARQTRTEADATWRAYIDATALQILAGMEPK